jgi:hypothetical protein
MLEISDLGLTIFQLAEVDAASEELVSAWLAQASGPRIENPTSLFIWGLRSGRLPEQDARADGRSHQVVQAEHWVANVGLFFDSEDELLDELFGRHGLLRAHGEDTELQKRMISLWAGLRPRGEEVEQASRERASRNAATYRLLHQPKEARNESGTDEEQR